MLFKRWGTLLKQESRWRKRSLVLSEFRLCLLSLKITYIQLHRIWEYTMSPFHDLTELNFNIIDQNKRSVYVIRLYVVLLQPLAFCFQRSQNESTGSFILSQEEVSSKGFFQLQTFCNFRNVSSRPGKYKIDANLHLTCTKSRRIYLHIWPTSYVENYQCQSYEAESIYLSGGKSTGGTCSLESPCWHCDVAPKPGEHSGEGRTCSSAFNCFSKWQQTYFVLNSPSWWWGPGILSHFVAPQVFTREQCFTWHAKWGVFVCRLPLP